MRLVVTALGVAALAGCGSTSHKSSGGSSGGTKVTVTEREFRLTLSQQTFSPGTYTFMAVDKGQLSHSLQIDGPGVSKRIAGTIDPGQSQNLSVTLQNGTYDIYCPVPGHKQDGMDARIKVGTGGSGGGATTTPTTTSSSSGGYSY
jgi:plastocyanin